MSRRELVDDRAEEVGVVSASDERRQQTQTVMVSKKGSESGSARRLRCARRNEVPGAGVAARKSGLNSDSRLHAPFPSSCARAHLGGDMYPQNPSILLLPNLSPSINSSPSSPCPVFLCSMPSLRG